MAVYKLIQQPLPGMGPLLIAPSRNALGALGERYAKRLLAQHGYHVLSIANSDRNGDLLARNPSTGELWRVEVKTARRGRDGRWTWNLFKRARPDAKHPTWRYQVDYRGADVVMLLAVHESGRVTAFCAPVPLFNNAHKFAIRKPDTYGGKLAPYRLSGRLQLEALSLA